MEDDGVLTGHPDFLREINQLHQTVIRYESRHADLLAVNDVTSKHIEGSEENLCRMERRREKEIKEINKERNAFIATCKSFQQEMEGRAEETHLLIPLKSKLLNEVESLKKGIEGVRFADEAVSRQKIKQFRQLRSSNAELQNEIDAESAQNEHLLRRIDGLNDALKNLPGCQEIARLEEDFEAFTEEKRNLEDGVVTLQQQLPILLGQEQKLCNLLKDQRRALQSLEEKINEVKLLQEAYENEFQDQTMEDTQENRTPFPPTQVHRHDTFSAFSHELRRAIADRTLTLFPHKEKILQTVEGMAPSASIPIDTSTCKKRKFL